MKLNLDEKTKKILTEKVFTYLYIELEKIPNLNDDPDYDRFSFLEKPIENFIVDVLNKLTDNQKIAFKNAILKLPDD